MRPPAASVTSASSYERLEASGPALSGWLLRGAVALSESPLGPTAFNLVAGRSMPRLFEVLRAEEYPEEPGPVSALPAWGEPAEEQVCASKDVQERMSAALKSLGEHAGTTKCSTATSARPTVLDYHFAYEQGMVTPTQVAERLVAFIGKYNPAQRWLSAWDAQNIREQAAASTARFAAGASLSVFDGVPFVVKDSVDALPYQTTSGTTFMAGRRPAKADAPCVAAMRELGAVLLGKGHMPELGCLPHGLNAHAGATLNPHHPEKLAGGSSSGAAAAVAVGLCPVAFGTDGGGSVRIPASLCGVVGLKPTMGRLADDHARGSPNSLVVSGPLANCVADALLAYAAMANTGAAQGGGEPRPLGVPAALLPLAKSASADEYEVEAEQPLKGLKVGYYAKWAQDCSPAVADVLKATLARLEGLGAETVNVTIPELELVQAGHMVTFLREAAAAADHSGWLNDWSLRRQLNLDTRMFLSNASHLSEADYTQAQRMRARALAHFERALAGCDLLLLPATPTPAPMRPVGADTGVYDIGSTLDLTRFTMAANLTGLPAITLPGGRQLGMSMPIGVQLMGKPWGESTLLRAAAALEQSLLEAGQPRPVPTLQLNPIQCEMGAHPKARELTKQLWSKKYGKKAAA